MNNPLSIKKTEAKEKKIFLFLPHYLVIFFISFDNQSIKEWCTEENSSLGILNSLR